MTRHHPDVVERLRGLTLAELIEVLSEVLPAHAERESVFDTKLVLAVMSRPLDSQYDPEYRFVEAVAWPDDEGYDRADVGDADLSEQGSCPGCALNVISTFKRARCPQCGAVCSLS